MKKLFLLLFVSLSVCALTHAQSDTTKAKNGSPMKQLNLTKQQQAKIKAADKNYKENAAKIKNDSTLTAAQKKQELKALAKQKQTSIDTVLTADQKNKLKEIKQEKKNNSPQKSKTSPKTT